MGAIVFRFTGIDNIYDDESIQKIPEADICTIDKLWLDYSYNRFGFSVQKRIFNELNEDVFELGEYVGWVKLGVYKEDFLRSYSKLLRISKNLFNELRFEIDVLGGHLPMPCWGFYYRYYYECENWQEDDDMVENNDMKKPNIIYIFSKLPQVGIEQD